VRGNAKPGDISFENKKAELSGSQTLKQIPGIFISRK